MPALLCAQINWNCWSGTLRQSITIFRALRGIWSNCFQQFFIHSYLSICCSLVGPNYSANSNVRTQYFGNWQKCCPPQRSLVHESSYETLSDCYAVNLQFVLFRIDIFLELLQRKVYSLAFVKSESKKNLWKSLLLPKVSMKLPLILCSTLLGVAHIHQNALNTFSWK